MKDIPVFTTEDGVASLLLKQIPTRQAAYIRVQDVQPGRLEALLAECAAFCRMAGAERVFADRNDDPAAVPQSVVYEMRGEAWVDKEKLANLFPVTEETAARWRQIYNERMCGVDHAAALSFLDEKQIITSGGAYFVHRAGELLGIGWVEEDRLLAIASVVPGAGERVAYSLMSLVEGAQLTLEVASTNKNAIRLYEKLGFLKTKELYRWYEVQL